ncbi:DUF916 and DUF3324 domain-containing protein [Lacticaseibacillus sp. GG6-2]
MKRLWLLLVLLAGLAAPTQTVRAENLHYSVAAQLPDNQIDQQVSYFALKVVPGSQQTLTLTITNKDTQAHRFQVSINRATTNTNGEVDYTRHELAAPASLEANIEQMATTPKTVTVPAQSAKPTTIQLRVPAKPFAGVALGGVRVVEVDSTAASSHKGLQLTNKFAYVVGLSVQETDDYKTIAPKLELRRVTAKQLNYRNYIALDLENTKPNLIHRLQLQVKVLKKGQKQPYITYTKDRLALAPNSRFTFPVSTGNQQLQAGNYTMILDAHAAEGNYRWHFQRQFRITNTKARQLNHTAVDQKRPQGSLLLRVLLIVIGLLVVVLGLVLVLMWHDNKKRHR